MIHRYSSRKQRLDSSFLNKRLYTLDVPESDKQRLMADADRHIKATAGK